MTQSSSLQQPPLDTPCGHPRSDGLQPHFSKPDLPIRSLWSRAKDGCTRNVDVAVLQDGVAQRKRAATAPRPPPKSSGSGGSHRPRPRPRSWSKTRMQRAVCRKPDLSHACAGGRLHKGCSMTSKPQFGASTALRMPPLALPALGVHDDGNISVSPSRPLTPRESPGRQRRQHPVLQRSKWAVDKQSPFGVGSAPRMSNHHVGEEGIPAAIPQYDPAFLLTHMAPFHAGQAPPKARNAQHRSVPRCRSAGAHRGKQAKQASGEGRMRQVTHSVALAVSQHVKVSQQIKLKADNELDRCLALCLQGPLLMQLKV